MLVAKSAESRCLPESLETTVNIAMVLLYNQMFGLLTLISSQSLATSITTLPAARAAINLGSLSTQIMGLNRVVTPTKRKRMLPNQLFICFATDYATDFYLKWKLNIVMLDQIISFILCSIFYPQMFADMLLLSKLQNAETNIGTGRMWLRISGSGIGQTFLIDKKRSFSF